MIRLVATVTGSLLLVGISAILLWQAYGYEPPDLVTRAASPTGAPAQAVPQLPAHAALDQARETLLRPLFVPGRRPPEARAPMPPSAPPAPSQTASMAPPRLDRVRLLGVRIDISGRAAFIDHPQGSRWVAIGDQVERWRVDVIESDRAELSWQDQKQVLRLHPALTP